MVWFLHCRRDIQQNLNIILLVKLDFYPSWITRTLMPHMATGARWQEHIGLETINTIVIRFVKTLISAWRDGLHTFNTGQTCFYNPWLSRCTSAALQLCRKISSLCNSWFCSQSWWIQCASGCTPLPPVVQQRVEKEIVESTIFQHLFWVHRRGPLDQCLGSLLPYCVLNYRGFLVWSTSCFHICCQPLSNLERRAGSINAFHL